MSPKTTLELQQTFEGTVLTGTTKSTSSTKRTQGCVRFAPRPGRSSQNARRPWKSLPAKVRIEISEAGTASVADGRGRLVGSPPEKVKRPPSGIHYMKCSARDGLAKKLRQLALSLQKEPDHSLRALLGKIEVSVREVRYCVHKAEQMALTSGFYGQPPRITI